MDETRIEELLEGLRSGKMEKVEIEKKDFMEFRIALLLQPDFKRFQGIAKRGGNVVYKYMDRERS